jgi:hypothetical protein
MPHEVFATIPFAARGSAGIVVDHSGKPGAR